jgi:hypothetical protein
MARTLNINNTSDGLLQQQAQWNALAQQNANANTLNKQLADRQQSVLDGSYNDNLLFAAYDRAKARKNAEMLTPLYKEQQAKSNAKALGNLMLANTKDGKLNVGNFMQQGLTQGQEADTLANAFKLMQADKELQNKGTAVSADAQLKADTDLEIAKLQNAFNEKKDRKDIFKDLREESKLTATQYSPDTANFINSNRRALVDDVKGTDVFESALSDVILENNKTLGDRFSDDPLGMLYNPTKSPLALLYHSLKSKEPTPSQINTNMLKRQLVNK